MGMCAEGRNASEVHCCALAAVACRSRLYVLYHLAVVLNLFMAELGAIMVRSLNPIFNRFVCIY